MIRLAIDASVDVETHCAGIGILWIEDGKQYPMSLPLKQPVHDNHLAEYYALLTALEIAIQRQAYHKTVFCQTDSQTVSTAIQKQYHNHTLYQPILEQCLDKIKLFDAFYLEWVSEKENKGADRLARQAMRKAKQERKNSR